MDCNLPGYSVRGISQARILESVAISFSRESSWPRDLMAFPAFPASPANLAGRFFTDWAPGKPLGVIEVFIILLLLMVKCREKGRRNIKICQTVQFKYVWFIVCHSIRKKSEGQWEKKISAFWPHPTSSTFLMYCLLFFSVCSYLWTLLFTMSNSSSLLVYSYSFSWTDILWAPSKPRSFSMNRYLG